MKNILVTGVSRGLGLSITKTILNNDNYSVYGISRSKTK
jgi:short-subunit dehydrogenase